MLVLRLAFLLSYVILFQCSYGCARLHGMAKSDINQLFHRYIKPLAEKFPNHELEVQFEVKSPTQGIQHKRALRKALRKSNKILRGNSMDTEGKKNTLDYVGVVSSPKPETSQVSTSPSQKEHFAVQYTTEKPATSRDGSNSKNNNSDKGLNRQPVYKDELQKALADLERKLTKNLLQGQVDNTEIYKPSQLIVSNSGPVNDDNTMQNINRIAELIKKGVQFQRHLPAPADDGNMEWMQIKIPKNLS